VVVTDAYLRYNGFKPVSVTAGNFKVPFSLEAVSSGKYLTFMERGLPFAFLNLRSLGGMVSTNGNNWTGAVGLFGDTVTQQNNDDEGWGVAGRLTYAPWFQKDRVLHLGFSGQWRVPDANSDNATALQTVRFRSKPESNIITDDLSGTGNAGRLVDTGNIAGDVNDYTFLGVEAAGVYGPASLQGEYIRTNVGRATKDDLAFDGYYIYGSYFLTGDLRNYKADKGVFDMIQPAKPFKLHSDGWGAWELAARYSALDLNDADVTGGEERNVTVGLNWYPNSFVRLMANYIHVLDINGGVHKNEDLDIFQVRTQVAY
jgi:phosphate-selective porin OprO/OprP